MDFCEQCGSSSRDKDGFCGGCGAPWPVEMSTAQAEPEANKPAPPHANLPATIGSIGLPDVQPKKVWVAVLLAVLVGPFGMLYSTAIGALVMSVVSVVLWFKFGDASFLITVPICAFWAWRAARESSSTLF